VDDYGNDSVVSAVDGKQVFFGKTYHEEPSVHIEIRSGNGIYSPIRGEKMSRVSR